MAYEVILSPSAQTDIEEHIRFIPDESPAEAAKWMSSLERMILSLNDMPTRFSLMPEATRLKLPYRSFMHHSSTR